MTQFKTREEWLEAALNEFRLGLLSLDPMPEKIRVSIGWPKGSRGGKNSHTIGQCWYTADDKIPQVYISPDQNDPVRILDILLHEAIHACYPNDGHKGAFKRAAKRVGLVGKMTATSAGDELKAKLIELNSLLGDFPHSKLNADQARKKQSTRMVKMYCETDGYICRASQSAINEFGSVICPACGERMEIDSK